MDAAVERGYKDVPSAQQRIFAYFSSLKSKVSPTRKLLF